MKVTSYEDCGNSPKNLFLKKFTIALLNCELKYIEESIIEEVFWEKVGTKTINGRDNVIKELSSQKNKKPTILNIESIISHGKSGSVNGIMEFKGELFLAFSNVYKIKGYSNKIKVKKIISYIINVKSRA